MMGVAGASEEQDVMAAGEHLSDHPKARKYRSQPATSKPRQTYSG